MDVIVENVERVDFTSAVIGFRANCVKYDSTLRRRQSDRVVFASSTFASFHRGVGRHERSVRSPGTATVAMKPRTVSCKRYVVRLTILRRARVGHFVSGAVINVVSAFFWNPWDGCSPCAASVVFRRRLSALRAGSCVLASPQLPAASGRLRALPLAALINPCDAQRVVIAGVE